MLLAAVFLILMQGPRPVFTTPVPLPLGPHKTPGKALVIAPDERSHPARLEIWRLDRTPRLVQALGIDEPPDSLNVLDVNHDGSADLILGMGGGTGGDSYAIFLFHPSVGRFRASAEYTEAFTMIRSYKVGAELHISSGYQDSCNESFYRPLRTAPLLVRGMGSALADEGHAGVGVVLRLRDGSYFRHNYTVALVGEDTHSRTPCSDPESAFKRARAAHGKATRK